MAKQKRMSAKPKGKQQPKRERPATNENAKLRRQLAQARREQVAAAEILKVISRSSNDLRPVLNAIAETAAHLCNADFAFVYKLHANTFHLAASSNANAAWVQYVRDHPISPGRGTVVGRTLLERHTVHVKDVLADLEYTDVQRQRLGNYRTILGVPLLHDQAPIGSIILLRSAVKPFSVAQINLVETFADQAVIAIENVRLFDEVQAKTRDLEESLQQQTATSEVLQVISSSPGELGPVFDTMLLNAMQLCQASHGAIWLREGEGFRSAVLRGAWPEAFAAQWRSGTPVRPVDDAPIMRAALTGKPVQIEDLRDSPAYRSGDTLPVAAVEAGIRTIISVPMFKDEECIGSFGLSRSEVRPFTEKQIELVGNFAKQGVIAIENARLLNELRQRTDDLSESLKFQTATSDVLKVISSSPDKLQPVLDVIVETSRGLCGADASTIFLLRERRFHVAAISGSLPPHLDYLRANPQTMDQRGSVLSRVAAEKRTLHYANVMDDPELRDGSTGLGGARAVLTVPLIRDEHVIGAILLRQSHLRPFTERQIQLIEVFADQAVIAISNVNLFDQVQERTRELSKSLEDLRAAQDRLVQTEKLASLGQLTAGIAHEIKNPLNFVNNFAALSAELTEELKDSLKPAVLDETIRGEVDEITGMLKDNLSKVVQHGKRADSIVKNMLQHSREGSGERRSADINALVGESLNLAYHGARAEKPGFAITLKHDLDPDAGAVSAGDYPGAAQSHLQRLLCCDQAQGRERRRSLRAVAQRGHQKPRRDGRNPDSRQWHRYPAKRQRKDVQSLLHYQADRRRNGAGPFDDP
jgi:two-component system, NtrC family, sensor kinase